MRTNVLRTLGLIAVIGGIVSAVVLGAREATYLGAPNGLYWHVKVPRELWPEVSVDGRPGDLIAIAPRKRAVRDLALQYWEANGVDSEVARRVLAASTIREVFTTQMADPDQRFTRVREGAEPGTLSVTVQWLKRSGATPKDDS